jgi:hypothetical protein
MWSRAWLQRRRTRSCYNTTARAEDIDEYKNMRMSKETFNMLLEKVRPYIMRSFTNSFVQLNFDILFELVCLKPASKTLTDFGGIELHPIFLKTLMGTNQSEWFLESRSLRYYVNRSTW